MEIVKTLHSYFAYIVLAVLLIAIGNALWGWWRKKEFSQKKDFRLSKTSLILSHIQLLLGLILYFISVNGFKAIQLLGIGGLNAPARLLALEHPLINIIALVFITVGWSRHKRVKESRKKFKNIALFYGLGLLLIVSRLPWTQWFNGLMM